MAKTKVWLILTVILGLMTSWLVFKYLTGIEKETIATVNMTDVVIAKKEIPIGTNITNDMVDIIKMPKEYAPNNYYSKVSDVINKVNGTKIFGEDVIKKTDLIKPEESTDLSYKLPKGKRAITIAVDKVSGVAGFLQPGHRVDILLYYKYKNFINNKETGPEIHRVVTIQNLEVLAVGANSTKTEEKEDLENITLSVDTSEAQLITLGENAGKLKVDLHSVSNKDKTKINALSHLSLSKIFP